MFSMLLMIPAKSAWSLEAADKLSKIVPHFCRSPKTNFLRHVSTNYSLSEENRLSSLSKSRLLQTTETLSVKPFTLDSLNGLWNTLTALSNPKNNTTISLVF
eukprot:Lithocolla_globosa_v1_NODE_1364_length_2631_cov_18.181677.p2 type:complete len:102 gc:universal NODE_1364_length_2631_cov_18.181677:1621-1316(-)